MCVPGVSAFDNVQGIIGVASTVGDFVQERKENKYRTQVAVNNAKNAQNEALRQKQMGIEKAREEKIAGIEQKNRQIAINSAGGFDAMSGTNQYSYQDIKDKANSSAISAQKSYNLQADSYFDTANSYLKQANEYNRSYNASFFQNSLQYLGNASKVAQNWYSKGSKENKNVYI